MMAKSPAVAMAYDAAIKQTLSDHVDHELGPGWRDKFGDIRVLVQALADGATRELMKAGWEFNPGVAWPRAVAARVVAAGHAGVLEYVGRPHDGRCEVPHYHTVTHYCSHGVWRHEKGASLPWTRAKQTSLLGEVCPCPLRRIVSEFHQVTAADELRRTWHLEMRAWLDDYLARQPDCACTPLLLLETPLGSNGQPLEVLAIVTHDARPCPVRIEPTSMTVSPNQGA